MADEKPGVSWNAAKARLTTFTSETLRLEAAAEWWTAIVGSDPESEQTQRPMQQTLLQGRLGDLPLALRLQPGRVDWYLGDFPSEPSIVVAAAPVTWSPIGGLDAASNAISTVAEQWFPLSPSISRIAYGSLQHVEVPSRVAGYEILDGFLDSVTIDAKNTSDFLLQLNRRRPSSIVKGLDLNRLMKWFVMSMTGGGIIAISSQGLVAHSKPEETSYYLSLDLDINTAPEHQDGFEPEVALAVWNELQSLGRDISDNGDRA